MFMYECFLLRTVGMAGAMVRLFADCITLDEGAPPRAPGTARPASSAQRVAGIDGAAWAKLCHSEASQALRIGRRLRYGSVAREELPHQLPAGPHHKRPTCVLWVDQLEPVRVGPPRSDCRIGRLMLL